MSDRTRFTRRAALGLIGTGGLLSVAHTYSQTSTSADRSTNVTIVDDPSAYLGIAGIGQDPRDELTVTNNTNRTDLEVTVSTTDFTIDNDGDGGSDTEWTFRLTPGGSQLVDLYPENANQDAVLFAGDILDSSMDVGTIELERTVTIPAQPGNGPYVIENVNSGLVMEADSPGGGCVTTAASVTQEQETTSDQQRWTVIDNGDGTYRLENVAESGYVLTHFDDTVWCGFGVGFVSFDTMAIEPWNPGGGGNDQRWNLALTNDGRYRLEKSSNTNDVADVDSGGTAPGDDVIVSAQNGTPSQEWIIKPA